MTSSPTFFDSPADWRTWLRAHHAGATELSVGFWKKASGRPSITWPESVDEALSFGWIDGVRHRIDDEAYRIRFTPRKAGGVHCQCGGLGFLSVDAQGLPQGDNPSGAGRQDRRNPRSPPRLPD